jgi:lysophospholipase L1-like esterase
MKSSRLKHPKRTLLFFNLIVIGGIVLIAEILLHRYIPYYTSLKPVIPSDNYYQYGWGNFPKEKIYFLSLDNGEVFSERVNRKGWRDKERSFKKPKNTFRILLLGDSELYGALVKNDERYPIILEKMLQENYRAEVISLSIYGWGTDQILEAIQLEGLKYQPDLIITQFNHNDINDNIYFQILKEKKITNENQLGFKPFYYDVNEENHLVKNINPYFKLYPAKSFSQKLKKAILPHSEILKRLYGTWLTFNHGIYQEQGEFYYNPNNILVEINDNRLLHFQMVFNLSEDDTLIHALRELQGSSFSKKELQSVLLRYKNYDADSILIAETIFEDLFFQDFWTPEIYEPQVPDTNHLSWQVFYHLMDSIHAITTTNHIPLAILPCIEEGSLDFFLKRYWVKNDSTSKVNSLLHNTIAKNYALQNQIEFIEPTRPLQRAKNDLHMDAAGNQTIAEEIYRYLIREYGTALEKYQKSN